MEDLIQEHWQCGEIIGFNCLVRRNGEIIMLRPTRKSPEESENNLNFLLSRTTLASLLANDQNIWSEIQTFTEANLENGDTLYAGEGSMGNEGFIVRVDNNNEFVWSLFFTESNPFYTLEIVDNFIHAISSTDLLYIIDLNNPEDIKIEKQLL